MSLAERYSCLVGQAVHDDCFWGARGLDPSHPAARLTEPWHTYQLDGQLGGMLTRLQRAWLFRNSLDPSHPAARLTEPWHTYQLAGQLGGMLARLQRAWLFRNSRQAGA